MTTKEKAHAKQNTQSKSSPKQLATVTDLSQDEVQAITDVINPLVADCFALYVKTKNYHWHLSGSHFRDYHLLFDKHAEQIFEGIDLLAERVRRVGGTTIHSIGQIGQLQTVEDDNSAFVSPADMIRNLMNDNAHMAQMYRAADEVAEQNRDFATSNVLEDLLDQAERRKWFLFEILQGQENTI